MSYVTSAEARDYIGITGSTYDSFLATAIDYCSELADTWSGRDWGDAAIGAGFNTHSVTETFDLDQRGYSITLREAPVSSIQSLVANQLTLTSSLYRLDTRTGIVHFTDSLGYRYPYGPKIQITYVAGYDIVPALVTKFVFRGVSYLFNRRDAEGVSSDLVADTQVTFRPMELLAIYEETMGALTLDLML